MKKENKSSPLIERILIIGVAQDELRKLAPPNKKVDMSLITDLNINILEEYKSNELAGSPTENYVQNISIVLNSNLNILVLHA
jgi:hypothetical protein